ncbi:UDP-N-acetylmuramoyl-L-alanyl-D-glutamate--2,6-diaminopimelate ligase [Magnetococcales bacterium HHB-1]
MDLQEAVAYLKPIQTLHFKNSPLKAIVSRPQEVTSPHTLLGVIDEYLAYGEWTPGRELLKKDPDAYPAALLTEKPITDHPCHQQPQIIVSHARKSLALLSKQFHGRPDEKMWMIGITGTDGKTTTTQIIRQWLNACGCNASALGTQGIFPPHTAPEPQKYTTPIATDLFPVLKRLQAVHQSKAVAMEVSSHGLALQRPYGMQWDCAVLTHLSRDHLDFHKSMDHYKASKEKLFSGLPEHTHKIINRDDPFGRELIEKYPGNIFSYGAHPESTLQRLETRSAFHHDGQVGITLKVRYQKRDWQFTAPLLGEFQQENLLAAMAVALSLGFKPEDLVNTASQLRGALGRAEVVPLPDQRVGIVDFAHTPDALENILKALKTHCTGRLIVVFGCGGDRDRGKRALMGEVAVKYADLTIVTSDNSRTEDPKMIIADILSGMDAIHLQKQGVLYQEVDRHRAIGEAYKRSKPKDWLLLAGKGHETQQLLASGPIPFNDRKELEALKSF